MPPDSRLVPARRHEIGRFPMRIFAFGVCRQPRAGDHRRGDSFASQRTCSLTGPCNLQVRSRQSAADVLPPKAGSGGGVGEGGEGVVGGATSPAVRCRPESARASADFFLYRATVFGTKTCLLRLLMAIPRQSPTSLARTLRCIPDAGAGFYYGSRIGILYVGILSETWHLRPVTCDLLQ